MPQQPVARTYTFADADLKQKADLLATSIKRDLAAFATRNINQTNLDALGALIAAFDETSTDEELLGQSVAATETKDATAEAVRRAIRPIRNMAEVAYKGKGKYHVFGFEDMANLSDNDLYRMGRRVVRVATRQKADLEPQGLTDAMLTNLGNFCMQLDTDIDNMGAQAENRDLETQDRVTKGNALYAEVMTLASIGKSLFEDSDEARYNDYVMIGSTPATNGNGAAGNNNAAATAVTEAPAA